MPGRCDTRSRRPKGFPRRRNGACSCGTTTSSISDVSRKCSGKPVFAAFGREPTMQLYERGIRRRLAPMLDGDRRRIELAYSLMFTLPGTPVVRYGDEIGMGY